MHSGVCLDTGSTAGAYHTGGWQCTRAGGRYAGQSRPCAGPWQVTYRL